MKPAQFGLFSLFILTTAAAGAFAIIRLPIPAVAKAAMVQGIAVCFMGWMAARNYRYPVAQGEGDTSARQRYAWTSNAITSAIFAGYFTWKIWQISPRTSIVMNVFLAVCILMLWGLSAWQVVRAIRV